MTHIGPLSAHWGGCSGVDCIGWVRMTPSQLGRYSHLGMRVLLWAGARCWAWFFMEKNNLLVANMYLQLFQSFLGIRVGKDGWMGPDGFG